MLIQEPFLQDMIVSVNIHTHVYSYAKQKQPGCK